MYAIPFGVPQYAQGKIGIGLGFSLLQGAGLGFAISKLLESNKVSSDTDEVVDERNVQETQINDPVQRQAFADETDSYFNSQLDKISQIRNQAYIGLGVFVLSWIGSGVEAYMNPPLSTTDTPGRTDLKLDRRTTPVEWSIRPSYIPQLGHTLGLYALNLQIRF
jgi:hypothetical protein